MSVTSHTRRVNPRLGIFYGIFSAGLLAMFMLLLIFEQLGSSGAVIRSAMLLGPVALFALIGVVAFTNEPLDFFAAGRRVPAFFTGLLLAITAFGATGIVAVTGAMYVIGFDALCLSIGGIGGFVVMATLFAPYMRKVGALTGPSFLGRRLGSRPVRLTAAALWSVPVLLVIAAEIRLGAQAAGWLVGQPPGMMAPLLALALLATIACGGMRSATWSGVAQAILALLALAVPVAIVAVFATNMPVPQLSHGPVLRALGREEIANGLPVVLPAPLAFEWPGQGFVTIAKRFSNAFGSAGSLAFTLMSLTVMLGVAAAPWLLPRVSTTPSVYDSRKSIGWAAFLFGAVMLTVASVAVFMRDFIMQLVLDPQAGLPVWLRQMVELDMASIKAGGGQFGLTTASFKRDAILFALPMAAGLPGAFLDLALSGAVAAALAGAASGVVTLGNILAEDVLNGLSWEPPPVTLRLIVGRTTLAAAALFGCLVALVTSADPLKLLLWALALTASTVFPVMLLAVWWKRLNAWGAMTAMAAGFTVTVLAILAGESGVTPLPSVLAGALGLPCAFAAALIGSHLTPAPDRPVLEMARDLRMPGGETLYDREMRLLRLKQRQRS